MTMDFRLLQDAELAQYATPVLPRTLADYVSICIVMLLAAGALTRGSLWARPDPYLHLFFERPQLKDGIKNKVHESNRNIAEILSQNNKDVVIFWGSQSGTAEAFANRLCRELRARFGLRSLAADLSDFNACTIPNISREKLVVFVMSTFGEGDPSDNAHGLWDWLLHVQANDILVGLRYAAFGLGNSNYKYYNKVIDVVSSALDTLGATRLTYVGKADEARDSTEEDFMDWKNDLFKHLVEHLGLAECGLSYSPTVVVDKDPSLDITDLHQGEPLSKRMNGISPMRALKIKSSRELFTGSRRNCLHFDLDISGELELRYKTGDHIVLWPMNPENEVDSLIDILGLRGSENIPLVINTLDPTIKVHVPSPTSTLTLFRNYLEINAPLSRDVLGALTQFAPTRKAKSTLLAISQDKSAYVALQQQRVLTIRRVLMFASDGECWTDLPLSFLVDNLPALRPRYYSISSSAVVSPRTISITAVVTKQHLVESDEIFYGVATNYLLALNNSLLDASGTHPDDPAYKLNGPGNALAGNRLYAQIRKSNFKLPTLSSVPVIMIAAGTGLAPFRGFIIERERLKTLGRPVGQMILFYGCRRPDEDYLYKRELERLQRSLGDDIISIFPAFSRLTTHKVYVQDRVLEQADIICELLEARNANLYVCGSATMAREVSKTIAVSFKQARGWTKDAYGTWSESQRRTNKWQEDVWG